jgi:hypothetical protein
MALLVMFIAACSSESPPPPAKTVFDPLTQQMQRAREVQKTVDEQAQKTRETVDQQERGDKP